MASVNLPKPVCLIAGICFNDTGILGPAQARLVKEYGVIQFELAPVLFSHTSYYEKEMGSPLYKMYIAFERRVDPGLLPAIKHFTNSVESEFSTAGRRNINIDPGYIEVPKLVLATTKNFSHRIYIGDGIYGDVQLYWQGGRFMPNPWTYPDYKSERVRIFFDKVRMNYFNSVKEN